MMTDENDIDDTVIEPEETEATTPVKAAALRSDSAVDQEPVLEEEPVVISTPPPPAAAPPPAPVSQRRGCILLFLGAGLGAVLGTVLTLSILLGLNGSLTFASTDAQLRRAINDTRSEQEGLSNVVATRAAHLEAIATQVGRLDLEQKSADEAMLTVAAELQEVEGGITAVATHISSLDNRLDNTEAEMADVVESANAVNAFLAGLRNLLNELEGTPTATAAASPFGYAHPGADGDGFRHGGQHNPAHAHPQADEYTAAFTYRRQ
ncbi:MAG: hypothetical protein M5U34_44135 [Chloroflexi bacterium]|nr:hypothetical protein [Chloroflexota bacterium]